MNNYKPLLFKSLLTVMILFACSILVAGDFETTKKAAEQGDAEAVRWYRMAAEQGIMPAQVNLGSMYDSGEGVPEDDAEAVRWYRMAAKQGEKLAQVKLGRMYLNGEGVPEDYVQAYAWLSMATAQGQKQAKKLKDIATNNMTREQIVEAQTLSRVYWEIYGHNKINKFWEAFLYEE